MFDSPCVTPSFALTSTIVPTYFQLALGWGLESLGWNFFHPFTLGGSCHLICSSGPCYLSTTLLDCIFLPLAKMEGFTMKATHFLPPMALLSSQQWAMEGAGGWVNFNCSLPLFSAIDIAMLFISISSWSEELWHQWVITLRSQWPDKLRWLMPSKSSDHWYLSTTLVNCVLWRLAKIRDFTRKATPFLLPMALLSSR